MKKRLWGAWAGLGIALATGGCSGGGGGGGGTPAIQIGFGSSASTTVEGVGIQIPVVLDLSIAALVEDLTITVSDAETGTATNGLDYTFVDQLLTFPAGSVDGAVQMAVVTPIDDSLVEGADETLRLTLGGQSHGKVKGATHLLTITDANHALVGFGSPSSAAQETDGTHAVAVVLELDPGDSLGFDLGVTVVDTLSGTATSGSHYAAFAPQTVTFPGGSTDGASFDAVVTIFDDAVADGDKTIVLALGGLAAGVQLASMSTHVLTISDDDVANGSLDVRVAGSSIAGGESFDLGTGVPLGTLGDSVSLQLQNLGATAIELSVLELSGDSGDFLIEAPQSALPSAPEVGVFPLAPRAMSTGLDAEPAPEAASGALTLNEADRAWLAARQHVVLHAVPLPGGGQTSVELWRLPSPWRPDARIDIDGEPLAGGVEALVGETSLWRGTVVGEPGSRVFLAFSDQGSRGWIRPAHGAAGEVVLVSGPQSEARMLWSATLEPAGGPQACSGVREVPGAAPVERSVGEAELALALGSGSGSGSGPPTAGMGPAGVSWAECSVAIETDYQFYQKFSGVQAATNYVTQLFAAISDLYERDVQTRVTIAYLGLHTTAADGWSTQDTPGSNAGDLLDEFQAAWAPNSWPVQADLAHFVSGASLGGGIAYLNVLCSPSFGFGVSANLHGLIDWNSFDGSSGGLNWDFVVVAHEIGHNFGSVHTHDFCPPLDLCASNCQSSPSCELGTIMSYCHSCGGMANIALEFHPYAAQVMRANVVGSCLGTAELLPGSTASFTLRFAPTSSAGAKSAEVEITHAATNLPSPLTFGLTGQASN